MGTRTRPNPARLQYALNRGGSQYWEKSIKLNKTLPVTECTGLIAMQGAAIPFSATLRLAARFCGTSAGAHKAEYVLLLQNGITHRRPTFTRSWAFLFLLASKFADCRIRSYNKPLRTFDGTDITWQRLLYDYGTDEACH
jgi:hypothetical protein